MSIGLSTSTPHLSLIELGKFLNQPHSEGTTWTLVNGWLQARKQAPLSVRPNEIAAKLKEVLRDERSRFAFIDECIGDFVANQDLNLQVYDTTLLEAAVYHNTSLFQRSVGDIIYPDSHRVGEKMEEAKRLMEFLRPLQETGLLTGIVEYYSGAHQREQAARVCLWSLLILETSEPFDDPSFLKTATKMDSFSPVSGAFATLATEIINARSVEFTFEDVSALASEAAQTEVGLAKPGVFYQAAALEKRAPSPDDKEIVIFLCRALQIEKAYCSQGKTNEAEKSLRAHLPLIGEVVTGCLTKEKILLIAPLIEAVVALHNALGQERWAAVTLHTFGAHLLAHEYFGEAEEYLGQVNADQLPQTDRFHFLDCLGTTLLENKKYAPARAIFESMMARSDVPPTAMRAISNKMSQCTITTSETVSL